MQFPDGRLVIVGAHRVKERSLRPRVRITLQELFLIWLGGRITSPRVWFGACGQGVTLKLAWGPSNSSPWNICLLFFFAVFSIISPTNFSFIFFLIWTFIGSRWHFLWYGFCRCWLLLLSFFFLLLFFSKLDVIYSTQFYIHNWKKKTWQNITKLLSCVFSVNE